MGTGTIICIGTVIICVVVAATLSAASTKKQQERFQYAVQRAGFTQPDRSDLSDNGKKGIAIDLAARKLCFYESESSTQVFKFSEITKCELIGGQIDPPEAASGGRVLAGHAIGTALGGFWGGVAGGMFASRAPGRKVERIGVKIVCSNVEESINTILFQGSECEQGDPLYKAAMMDAEPWHTILNHIIAQNARQYTGNSNGAPEEANKSPKIHFYCEYCGRRITVSKKHAGRKGKCPSCKEVVIVAVPDDTGSASPRRSPEPEEQIGKCGLCLEPTGDMPEKSNSGATICVNCKELLSPISTRQETAIHSSAESEGVKHITIEFQCDGCGKHYRLSNDTGGNVGKCKKCGNLIRVPKATTHYNRHSIPTGDQALTNKSVPKTHANEDVAALKPTRHEIKAVVTAPELAETEETSTSQNIGIIAGVVAVMVIVGIFIVWLSLRNGKPGTRNSTRTTSRQRVANQRQRQTFARYEDKKYGFFSCRYPSGWTTRELDDPQNRRVQFLGREAEIRIRITKAQGSEVQSSKLAEMAKRRSRESFPKGKGTFISERTFNVAGIPAYEMQYRQNQPRARCRVVMLYANRRLHVLMFAAPTDSLFNKWSGGFSQFLASYAIPGSDADSSPSPPETRVSINQQTWRPYTDPKGRFVCKVPPGWTIRETKQDPRSKVSFSCRDGEIGIITRNTGRHILDESDRRELVSITQNLMRKIQQMGQQARLISVEWTSIGGIKGLKTETEFIKPERFWAKQMKFKRDRWDHCITLTVKSLDQRKNLEMLFDEFLREYKNQSR